MKFISDLTVLTLAIGLLCGGPIVGKQIGGLATLWLAGTCGLALRFADILWKPTVLEWYAQHPGADRLTVIPASYYALFLGAILPTLLLLLLFGNRRKAVLPKGLEGLVCALGGLAIGFMLLGAFIQSQLLTTTHRERIPQSVKWMQPILEAAGQTNTHPPTTEPDAASEHEHE